MADYYPSEIARLVLGYMKEVCPKTWEAFLEESDNLQEHRRLLEDGKSGSTNIGGKSLIKILHEYRHKKHVAERKKINQLNPGHIKLYTSCSIPRSSKRIQINSYSRKFLTPEKLHKRHLRLQNLRALTRITKSEAAIRFAESGHLSTHSVQKNLDTPTRSYSFMAPDQSQIKCVTALNFDIDAGRN